MEKKKTAAARSKNTQAIVDAACALFGEKRYTDITVRDICARAGVSGSSFYSVFSGKDDIVTYVIRELKEDSATIIELMIRSQSDLEKIWRLFDCFIRFALHYGPDFFRTLMFVSAEKNGEIMPQFYQYSEWFEILVKSCQENGIIRNTEDPKALVQAASNAAFGIVYEWCGRHGDFDIREACFRCHESIYNVVEEYRGIWKDL